MAATGAANAHGELRESPMFDWAVHLARLAPAKTMRALLLLVAAAALVGAVWGSLLAGAVAFALLLLSTSEYFFPVRFRLTAHEATARGITTFRRIPWDRARRILCDSDGIKISPLSHPSWLEPFRGVYLRFPVDDPAMCDRILKVIESHAASAHIGDGQG